MPVPRTRLLPQGPDWLLRSGYGLLVVWRPDTGEVVSTSSVRPLAYREEHERRLTALGTLADVTAVREIAPEVVGWPEIATLRRWATEHASVRALLLASGRARHLIWEELSPVLLGAFEDGRGSFAGDRLVLHTSRRDAAVTESPDLLAGHGWPAYETAGPAALAHTGADVSATATLRVTDDSGDEAVAYVDVVRPLGGAVVAVAPRVASADGTGTVAIPAGMTLAVRVCPLLHRETADGVEAGVPGAAVPAYGAEALAALATREVYGVDQSEDVLATLPGGTYGLRVSVEVTGSEDDAVGLRTPVVLTRRPSGAPPVAAGGWWLEAENTLTPWGDAAETPGDDFELEFDGVTYTLPTVEIGPPAVLALVTRAVPAVATSLTPAGTADPYTIHLTPTARAAVPD